MLQKVLSCHAWCAAYQYAVYHAVCAAHHTFTVVQWKKGIYTQHLQLQPVIVFIINECDDKFSSPLREKLLIMTSEKLEHMNILHLFSINDFNLPSNSLLPQHHRWSVSFVKAICREHSEYHEVNVHPSPPCRKLQLFQSNITEQQIHCRCHFAIYSTACAREMCRQMNCV